MADSVLDVIFINGISKNWIRDWNFFHQISMQILTKKLAMFLELQYILSLWEAF